MKREAAAALVIRDETKHEATSEEEQTKCEATTEEEQLWRSENDGEKEQLKREEERMHEKEGKTMKM